MTMRSLTDPPTVQVPRTENDALIETTLRSAEPAELEPGKVYSIVTPGGRVETIDLTGDEHRDRPRRKTGTTTVRDIESFGQYWRKHADGDYAEVYADLDRDRVVAVLDAHGSAAPGWGEHRLTYALRKTEAWKIWLAADGRLMSQTEFAEHLEARLPDIASPDGADLLELAQTFQANTNVTFKSGNLLASGERELVYAENIEASGGRGRKLTIPKGITLHIPPYEDSDPFPVTGRFRYRISDGNLRLGYVLDRPAELLADAFNAVVDNLAREIDFDIMRGVPA